MILSNIQSQVVDALKSKDELRLAVLRMLLSALNYEKIAKQHELSSEEELAVVKKEAKKRQDAIVAYKEASRSDRAEIEERELVILKEFLPAEMDEAALEKIVADTIVELDASSKADMGKVMRAVMEKTQGSADGGRVSKIVASKLQ